MPLIINTNVQSMNSQRQLVKSGMEMSTAMERLSSGKRINSAADDAAGLAIASRMTSQIRGLSQAVRNANDGISLIQVAGGALGESTNILQRMRELAIQSSNGIYTDANRTSLNAELEQLKSELTRIAETTSFNGLKVLDGTLGQIDLQIGSEAGETIGLDIGSGFTAEALGASEGGVSSGSFTLAQTTSDTDSATSGNQGLSGTSNTLKSLNNGDLIINGVSVPATESSFDLVSSTDNTSSALAIATAINSISGETGVVAEANAVSATFTITDPAGNVTADHLKINGVGIAALTDAGTDAQNAAALAVLINDKASQTGVVATVSGAALTLTAVDGRNIQYEIGSSAAALSASFTDGDDKVVTGSITLRSNSEIDLGGNNASYFGFTEGATEANKVSALQAQSTFATNSPPLTNGDLTINGYTVNFSGVTLTAANEQSTESQTSSAMYNALAINSTDGLKDQVLATAFTEANLGKVSEFAAGTDEFILVINDQDVTITEDIKSGDSNGYLAGVINQVLGGLGANNDAEGIIATVNDNGELILTASDGRNIDVEVKTGNLTDTQGPLANLDTTTTTHVVAKGTISLTAKDGYSVGEIGGDKRILAGIESSGGTVASTDISTQAGAQDAISVFDRAIDTINAATGNLGAANNRLDFTVSNLSAIIENAAASRSSIMDADFAAETAQLSRAQVLQQAASAMLAQANALPSQVLSLLR